MCKQNRESVRHLFLQCSLSKVLWIKVFSEFGINMEVLDNFLDLLQVGHNSHWTSKKKLLWMIAIWGGHVGHLD